MASLMRAFDWSASPVGPPAAWPESLRTALRICLTSSFPMWIWWGPDYTMFYNDAHRPMLGPAKHPHWLGRSARGCWAEIWKDVAPMLEAAEKRGEAAGFEDLLLVLDRSGIKEETYFTFSISPVLGAGGRVDGLICPTTETTRKVISERRLRALRELGASTAGSKSEAEACAAAARVLGENPRDVPFALVYRTEPGGRAARLEGAAGLLRGSPDAPERIDFSRREAGSPWPLWEVQAGAPARHLAGPRTSAPLPGGPWPEPCRDVLVLPAGAASGGRPSAFLVAGASPRRILDQDYRAFFDLVAGHLSTALSGAGAYQEERRRAESLTQLDRAKTEFFSNVSHEFRTPLTLMLGPLEESLAERREPLPPSHRERLETAHRNSLRLLRLVNSLLDFSCLEAGRVRASFERTDLAAYTSELADVFRSAVERAGLTLTVDCPPLPEPVYVDREMWEKIVHNLLSNALKFTFAGGIAVRLRWTGSGAELDVEDTGVGIPGEELPHLFERFHRVRNARSRTHEGTGIGLALVKELAALHGGDVQASSQEGKGSTFRVTVKAGTAHLPAERVRSGETPSAVPPRGSPLVEEALLWLPEADPQEEAPPSTAKDPRPQGRVLVADDNADMRSFVTRILSEYFTVESAANGAEALISALHSPPDLVLSDVMMPGIEGFELLEELRRNPATRTVPVILLSARAGEEAKVGGLEAGADDYLVKPFSARELVARVRSQIELARLRRAAELTARELSETRAELLRDLEGRNRDLESYGQTLAHDLGAPLRSIAGFGQILLEDHFQAMGPEAKPLVERMVENAGRMSRLIRDLLALNRISRDTFPLEPVPLEAALRESLGQLEGDLKLRGADVQLIGTPLPAVLAHRTLLVQVLSNLIGNASKFVTPGTRPVVRVRAERSEGAVRVWVEDNGVGIDRQHHRKIFEAFHRLHSEDEYAGSGMGLAIVRRGIERMNGKVGLESEPGRGSRFWVELPEGSCALPNGSGTVPS